MPMHSDFAKVKRAMRKKYGDRAEEVYHRWVNKHGYDDTKPLDEQKSKATAEDLGYDPFYDWMDEEWPEEEEKEEEEPALEAEHQCPPNCPEHGPKPGESEEIPLHDGLNRMMRATSAAKGNFLSIPAFKTHYVAQPKFEGKEGPIIVKALVLEEGLNVNKWRVVPEEFEHVAAQYKAGRQLRLNHSKDVEKIIGKSFDGKVMKGRDIAMYFGKDIPEINPEGSYVAAEFEANPQDAQVRTNILQGYVETGSIGLDAEAFCDVCDQPLKLVEDSFDRTCRHLEAGVKLKNVEVKEYSYVAEPAFPHTKAYPSFGAAVNSSLTLSILQTTSDNRMPDAQVSVPAKIEVDAAKKPPQPIDKAEAEADALIRYYKKGREDAIAEYAKRFRAPKEADAEGEGESESEGDADAKSRFAPMKSEAAAPAEGEAQKAAATAAIKKQTDQIGRVMGEPLPNERVVAREMIGSSALSKDTIEKIRYPTLAYFADPLVKEFYEAMASQPTTPADVRVKWVQKWSKGRFD